jgi:ribosome-associated translation inhibitor RaiA
MEAIEAVLELAKERDHIADELETYEDWFDALIGRHVTLTVKTKKHTRFVECEVTEFVEGEGWELQGEDDSIYVITFLDFVKGLVQVHA